MARYANQKKVSWAPNGSLCQIRQFSSEDCPAKVGLRIDDNLKLKYPHTCQAGHPSKNLPPGFLRTIMKNSEKLFRIPTSKWKCPPKVDLDPDWLVASGEQSKELFLQKHREMKVFEAVYPRLTDIPLNPSGALCLDGYLLDDHTTPAISTTPIEDEEAAVDQSSVVNPTPLPVVSASRPSELSNRSGSLNSVQVIQAGGIKEMISSTKADVEAAASAAVTALLKSNEIGSSVDTNMLIDILNNPKTVSMLLNRIASASTKPTTEQVLPSVNFSCPSNDLLSSTSASGNWGGSQFPADIASTMMQPRYVIDTMVPAKSEALPTSIVGSVIGPSHMPSFSKGSQHNIANEVPLPPTITEIKPNINSATVTPKLGPPTQVKDANYYKNLIKQHGSDNQNFQGKIPHTQQVSHDNGLTKNGHNLGKNPRPCVLHTTPRGCRKGLECPFRHDITSSYQIPHASITEIPNAKRMKLGRAGLTNITC